MAAAVASKVTASHLARNRHARRARERVRADPAGGRRRSAGLRRVGHGLGRGNPAHRSDEPTGDLRTRRRGPLCRQASPECGVRAFPGCSCGRGRVVATRRGLVSFSKPSSASSRSWLGSSRRRERVSSRRSCKCRRPESESRSPRARFGPWPSEAGRSLPPVRPAVPGYVALTSLSNTPPRSGTARSPLQRSTWFSLIHPPARSGNNSIGQ